MALTGDIWLVGAGNMGVDYAKVLEDLGRPFLTIGRSAEASRCFRERTGLEASVGGLDAWFQESRDVPASAIVCVSTEEHAPVTRALLEYGVRTILLEKPGGVDRDQIATTAEAATRLNAEIYLAYNRRFFSSVRRLREIVAADGGVSSFYFDFTELVAKVSKLKKGPGVKEKWFLVNSTHVVDLAFFIAGRPVEIDTHSCGGLDWHPSASVFSGSGISDSGALFSYAANWEAPGRWGVEMLTRSNRLVLRPLESLQVQPAGSFEAATEEIDDTLDADFKPGLHRMVSAFLDGDVGDFCTVEEQQQSMDLYYQMANYT